MRESQRSFGLQIAQDQDPDTQCRPAQRIELIEVRRLIQVRDHDERVIVVCSEGRVGCAPTHSEIGLESRVVELLDELAAVLVVRVEQQRARIVRDEQPGLHGSTTALH